jgi:uncharacterized repeat protein (TIGR03803 family)
MDSKGSLYGATKYGGDFTCNQLGCGVVFKLRQNPDCTWTERVLHRFGGTAEDGQFPVGNLVRDKQGNLYGVTSGGAGISGDGTAFEVDAAGQETILHAFDASPTDGVEPQAGLTMDASGNLYGTAAYGGSGDSGTVFKITP